MLKELLNKRKSQKGFTIIEVMIVLAIAGLILVVVLVAIPQLQKNQRNENRKSVLARVAAEVNNYIGNNEAEVPTADDDADTGFADGGGFHDRYIANVGSNTFNTPGGDDYEYLGATAGTLATEDQIIYLNGARCQGELIEVAGSDTRNFAIAVWLEGGANFCVDNE